MGSTRPYKKQTTHHEIVVNNELYHMYLYEYTTYCYSSYNHIEHTCISLYNDKGRTIEANGRSSWCNRPWQEFDYANSRRNACDKLPNEFKEPVHELIVEQKHKQVHEECERFLKSFETGWNALNDDNKKMVADKVGMIENEAQANAALGLVHLTALMQ